MIKFSAFQIITIVMSLFAPSCQSQDILRASISEIKSNPLKYEGKIVRVSGYVKTAHVVGFSLLAKESKDMIHLERPDVIASPLPVHKDVLFNEFWDIRTDTGREPPWVEIEVELDGYVSLLKVNGKLAEEFTFPGRFPIELIPIRVIKINKVDFHGNHQ
jgi:hypothetical protein